MDNIFLILLILTASLLVYRITVLISSISSFKAKTAARRDEYLDLIKKANDDLLKAKINKAAPEYKDLYKTYSPRLKKDQK